MPISLFAHDTEVALGSAAALVNTSSARTGEALGDVDDLRTFVERWGWTGRVRADTAELAAVRDLRPRLRGVWALAAAGDEDAVAGEVNDVLAAAHAVPQAVRHDGWSWHLHATPPEAPLERRMAVEAAMALVDVLRAGELGRLRVCGAADCDHVMVDLSRNASRRYCSTTCANRVNVAAFRSRRSADG